MNEELTKKLGKRILSEANDLKRTISALAKDIGVKETFLGNVINGDCELKDSYKIIEKMGSLYPIDVSDLYLQGNDCENSLKIMKAEESYKTSRVFDRLDKNGIKTPYYEYRDTAMSNIGPYKPEWIKELRIVDNSDPYNPDVAYNNGHFLHQTTFFVGPVNFYWEVDGKKNCREMNTGDSNYITPFWPHSFANRDSSQEAYILAITFGGEVRRAQKELYALGKRSNEYNLDYRNYNKAIRQLINQHLMNENMTFNNLNDLAKKKSIKNFDINKLIDDTKGISIKDLNILADLLNIELEDLSIPKYKPEDEVVVKHSDENKKYYFPNTHNSRYKIDTLARTSKMPLLKGLNIEVLTNVPEKDITTSLHTYAYNYGESDVVIYWESEGNCFQKTIRKDDSLYIQPFIKHGFSCSEGDGKLYLVRVSGAMNLLTQRELSYFSSMERVFSETKCWFD